MNESPPLAPSFPFLTLLQTGLDRGGFETDDALAVLLPLFRQVATAHENGLVAPLCGVQSLQLTQDGALAIDPTLFSKPVRHVSAIERLLGSASEAVEVVGEARRATDLDAGEVEQVRLDVAPAGTELSRPAYLAGYVAWEHTFDHHDPITDIFSLGLLLASVSCHLDFTRLEGVQQFASFRHNLFRLNPRIHPVVARVIVQMTELNRHRRAPDLAQMVRTLETYRDQPADLDLSRLPAGGIADRRRLIHDSLRDRLFEISRRNRLIYFKPTLQTLNLTIASVPLVMDVKNIRLEQLFVWHTELASAISQGQAISLGKYLRIEDAPYIPGVLDKIIAEARRDRAEYGFAQLRLVLCFLRWHNLKEAPQERIHSPLLLLPVELTKRKGVRDAYILTPTSTEAEVNPALRHHLRCLYGVTLPETINLQETSLHDFHTLLQERIRATEPGVTLERIDRPKIELIHAKARQRLDQWQKRQVRLRTSAEADKDVQYSNAQEHYLPKGLQLFNEKVRPQPLPLGDLVGAAPRPRVPELRMSPESAGSETSAATSDAPPAAVQETAQQQYALQTGEHETGNPYQWSYDLSAQTLGNFHYRKMTLVRDYAKIADDRITAPAFDALFSLEPKQTEDLATTPLALAEQFPVIPCDAAQAAAVARARQQHSFIIQGPPGTGKSQTITNLIADFVARGKRVLFVCEKRAAIDVVFHRLRQQGLDELCCLIHDSQADKRAFIQNLKQSYEKWVAEPAQDEALRIRAGALRTIEHDLAALERFSEGMTQVPSQAGVPTRALLHRLIETREALPQLSVVEEEQLPLYAVWLSHGSLVERLQQTLTLLRKEPVFARHPFRSLHRDLVLGPRPLERMMQLLDRVEPLLDGLESSLELSGVAEAWWGTFREIEAILDYAQRLLPLAQHNQLSLLDGQSAQAQALTEAVGQLERARRAWEAAKAVNVNWKQRLDPTDTARALEAAEVYEGRFLRFLQPSYWRLRKTVHERYDFAQHAVPPTLKRVLLDLQAEQFAEKSMQEATAAFAQTLHTESAQTLLDLLANVRGTVTPLLPAQAGLRRQLLESPKPTELVRTLAEIRPAYLELKAALGELLHRDALQGITAVRELTTELRQEMRTLPELLPLLSELVDAPEALRHAICHLQIPLSQFEPAIAEKTLKSIYRSATELTRFDAPLLQAYTTRLKQQHALFLKTNAEVIRANVRRLFREHVQISSLPAAQLTEEQKVFKKAYATGRRELEHEFGKTMRYRSIRDLATDETGLVVRDLKPIWLMSPLSVSDTLPLDPTFFDVVIFDEASQIPVEEAVPAVYRAAQVIVVGDEMQLPPTSFFSSSRSGDEELGDLEVEGERIEVDLDADSFLAQSARNLPSTLLAWHYRSRYENLISFSNAAFYAGSLHTIPDRHLAGTTAQAELIVTEAGQAAGNTDALLQRSLSFHFLEHGVYEQRRNAPEADYIAQTVRELLRRETKLSVGIVAFSQAQQTEIERALDTLAETDKEFAARYEAEINREEDDQFCGLFVKNLENVQGDERDVIILSICYGYDRAKRMLMNFGPINQRGGEKRLNVIFSRARQHMAVVSSIRHTDITNDYNDGANALRNFLRYAECSSRGDLPGARTVLENLNPLNRQALAPKSMRDAVIEQLALALRAEGHVVDLHVGQSKFRCDLGLRDRESARYTLGVLVDTEEHYANRDLMDRYLTRPGILNAFGWKVVVVLTKDWFHQPQAVLERIKRELAGNPTIPVNP